MTTGAVRRENLKSSSQIVTTSKAIAYLVSYRPVTEVYYRHQYAYICTQQAETGGTGDINIIVPLCYMFCESIPSPDQR